MPRGRSACSCRFLARAHLRTFVFEYHPGDPHETTMIRRITIDLTYRVTDRAHARSRVWRGTSTYFGWEQLPCRYRHQPALNTRDRPFDSYRLGLNREERPIEPSFLGRTLNPRGSMVSPVESEWSADGR